MTRAAVLAAALALGGCASLPRADLAAEVAYQTLLAVDTVQTLEITRHPDKWYEANPLLGRNPSAEKVVLYMAASSALHLYVSNELAERGAPAWVRAAWHVGSIGVQGVVVKKNIDWGHWPR